MNTTYFLNCTAGNLFGTKKDPAIPEKYYIGLSLTKPNVNGTNVTEPSESAGYRRVELTSLSEPSSGVVTNQYSINFEESTSAWGTIAYFVIFDSEAVGSGNLLMYGDLTTARTVEAATIMTIKEGYLTLSAQNPS